MALEAPALPAGFTEAQAQAPLPAGFSESNAPSLPQGFSLAGPSKGGLPEGFSQPGMSLEDITKHPILAKMPYAELGKLEDAKQGEDIDVHIPQAGKGGDTLNVKINKLGDNQYQVDPSTKLPEDSALAAAIRSHVSALPGAAGGLAAMGVANPFLSPLDSMGTPGRIAHVAGDVLAGGLGGLGAELGMGQVRQDEGTDQAHAIQANADQTQHPIASELGGLTPELFKPGFQPQIANRLMLGGIGAGVSAGQSAINAHKGVDPLQAILAKDSLIKMGIAAAQNSVFNETTGLGDDILGAGKAITQPLAGLISKVDVAATHHNPGNANAAANDIQGIQPIPELAQTRLGPLNPSSQYQEKANIPELQGPNLSAEISTSQRAAAKPTPERTKAVADIEDRIGLKDSDIPPEVRLSEIHQAFDAADAAQAEGKRFMGKFGSGGEAELPALPEKPSEPAAGTKLAEGLRKEATTGPQNLNDLEGESVFWNGKRGILQKGDDGAWVVVSHDTTGSAPLKREYEIPRAAKDGTTLLKDVGIVENPTTATAPSTELPAVPGKPGITDLGGDRSPASFAARRFTEQADLAEKSGDYESAAQMRRIARGAQKALERGSINPAVFYHLGAPVVGGVIGSQFGDTKEERARNAILGALIGLGGSLSTHAAIHLAGTNPAFLDRMSTVMNDLHANQDSFKQPEGLSGLLSPNQPNTIPDALQKQGASPLDVRPSPGNGEGVGIQNPINQGAALQGKRIAPPKLIKTPEAVSVEQQNSPEYRKKVSDQIVSVINRVKQPGVDIKARDQAIRMVTEHLGLTEDQFKSIAKSDQPIENLEALRDSIITQHNLGKLDVKSRQQLAAAELGLHMADMQASKSDPLNSSQYLKDDLDPTKSPLEKILPKIANKAKQAWDEASVDEKYLLGRDVLFDIADGRQNYKGFNNRFIGGKLDSGFQAEQELAKGWRDPVIDLVRKNGIDETSAKRIGIYGILNDKSGDHEIRLKNSDATPEAIERVKKDGLTQKEMEVYNAMRDGFDGEHGTYNAVAPIMHSEYNKPVDKIDGYWPLHRDYDAYEAPVKSPIKQQNGEQEGLTKLIDNMAEDMTRSGRTSKTNQHLTDQRVDSAKTPLELNAVKTYEQHVNAAAHLVANQHNLTLIGRVVRTPEYAQKYGDLMQKLVLNNLDSVARDGAPAGSRRIQWLDQFTRNESSVVLGFRLLSQLKHVSNVGIAIGEVGLNKFSDGLHDRMTNEGSDWIKNNAIESSESYRSGGEQSIQDVMKNAVGLKGKFQKIAFWLERKADGVISEATVLAAYKQECEKIGVPYDLSGKPNPEALRMALITSRKVVTSSLIKDQPQAISRAALTDGNISLARALFQFQSTMLRQYAYARHDILGLGLRNLDYNKFIGSSLGFLAAISGETGLVQLNRQLFGKREEKGPNATFLQQAALEATKRIPFAGNVMGAAYGLQHDTFESGIPTLDSILAGAKSGYQLYANKNDYGRPLSKNQRTAALGQVITPLAALPSAPLPYLNKLLPNPAAGIPGVASAVSVYKNQPSWFKEIENKLK